MKHGTSRQLHAYWTRLRGNEPAPQRGAIDPKDIRQILSETLILEVVKGGPLRFRLAGTGLCSVFCQELQGKDFLALWSEPDRHLMAGGVESALAETTPVIFEFVGSNDRGQEVAFEGLLLPLLHLRPPADRLIGSLSALSQPYWLGTLPIVRQRLNALRLLRGERTPLLRRRTDWPSFKPPALPQRPIPAPAPPPSQKPSPPARRAAFTVFEGGKR